MICFSNLIKFEARDNKIDDLIELEMCNTLEYLDLKNNLIEEGSIFKSTLAVLIKLCLQD